MPAIKGASRDAPAYSYHHAYVGGSWIEHMIILSVVHGLIYSVIFRVLQHLSLSEVILLAVVVIGGIWMWQRNQDAIGGGEQLKRCPRAQEQDDGPGLPRRGCCDA